MRLFVEGYLLFLIGAFLNILHPVHQSYGDWIALILTYIMMGLIVVVPILYTFFLNKHFKILGSESVLKRCGELVEVLAISKKASILYHLFFMTRRMVFVVTVIFL